MTRIATWVRSISVRSAARLSGRRMATRFRLRARDSAEWVQDALSTGRETLLRWSGRDALPILQQRERLIEFYERYEELVGAVCDAARSGDPGPFEEDYRRAKCWMARDYPPIKRSLAGHLRLDAADDNLGLRFLGKPTDGFEALVVAPTLREALDVDQGDLIHRLERTRSALNRYGDHLRRSASI